MYCKKCGNEVEENCLFCSTCGGKLQETNIPNTNTPIMTTSIVEKILRAVNIIVMSFAIFVGLLAIIIDGDILNGIVMAIVPTLLIIFVFRKSQILKIKQKIQSPTTRKLILTMIYILLIIVTIVGFTIGSNIAPSTPTIEKIDENAISYAQNILRDQLKNPESLQVHSAQIYVKFDTETYYYYNIEIDYSAQNGFGGYNRKTYNARVKVRKSDAVAMDVSFDEYFAEIQKYNERNAVT